MVFWRLAIAELANLLPTEGDGRLWHTVETSSGWDTNLITAGATLDAPASIVHLPDNDTLAVVYGSQSAPETSAPGELVW